MKPALFLFILFSVLNTASAVPAVEPVPTGSFQFQFTVEMPGKPGEVFGYATGDISPWWDHSMAEKPMSLNIDAKPGGHFLEVMDAAGNGVIHATVTQVVEGRMLRLVGPLGLAGHAIHMVSTWTLEESGENTLFTVEVHAAGEVHEGWGEVVEKTWRHFIEDQLKGYLETLQNKQ